MFFLLIVKTTKIIIKSFYNMTGKYTHYICLNTVIDVSSFPPALTYL